LLVGSCHVRWIGKAGVKDWSLVNQVLEVTLGDGLAISDEF
jgi:hypothetical protein